MNLKGGRPERFGAIASFFYRLWAEPALSPMHDRIAAEIPLERGRILDVGCGPGRLTRRIAAARPNAQVTGLDLSADMIRQAERGPGLPNLVFRHGRPATLEGSGPFDFALSVLSFHHWEDPAGGLEAVHGALAPTGRFWIYEPDSEASDEDIRRDHAPLWGWLRLPGGLHRRMAKKHGFSLAEIDRLVRPAVAQTSFRECAPERRGSTIRIELVRR